MIKYFNERMSIVHRILRLMPMIGLLALLVGCAGSTAQPSQPVVGAETPDFALPALSGETLRLSELQGRVVIINFWASWCQPCVNETPRLVSWYEQHNAAGLQVIGVDTLYHDSRESVETRS